MAEALRIAVVGLGAMGSHHVRVLGKLPEARLVAAADIDERRLGEAAQRGVLRAYRDYRELLAEEALEAVVVAVPTRQHAPVALAAIERSVPVLVEKPLAADIEEAERLRAAAEERGVPLMVGHVERFNPAVQDLKRRLAAGELGRAYQAFARRVGPFYPRERDVGVVHDLATHDIDVLRYLLGCEVERVQAETQRGIRTPYEDALLGLLRFEDGAVGLLEVNWLAPRKERRLTVFGERGVLALDYLSQELQAEPSQGSGGPAPLPVAREEPLRVELSAFLRVARGIEPPPVSAADGIAALRVAAALVAAARRGEPVRVAPGEAAR